MSRIGKLPITLPAGVAVTVGEDNVITLKGPKGELQQQVNPNMKVKVDNAGKQIMPGMVCKAYLPSMDKSNGIVIPLKAVQVASSGQNFIWTMDKSGKATTKEVVTGKLVGNGVLIQSGLKEGDVVIIEGYQNLSLGISVKAI